MTSINNIPQGLRAIVDLYTARFNDIDNASLTAKPEAGKWSKKEVIGHLIDSAQNNLRRFIVGQYEPGPHIVYAQDFWVSANRYNEMDKADIIQLWRLMNERICVVLEQMPERQYHRVCNTGKSEPVLHTLEWLADDYVSHLKHHINQIIPEAFPGF